jgi:hypothetical protein
LKKSIVRRSISIPKELDDQITIMTNKYSYHVKNELYIELLELGIIKFDEDIELKQMVSSLLTKIELLLEHLKVRQ